MSARDRTVLLAGATSPAGLSIARALVSAGARVIAVGRDQGKLDALAAAAGRGSVRTEVCHLTNEAEVAALAERLAADGEHVDAVVPLVGGWRGGGGLAGQTESDYRALEDSFTVVRVVSRAFDAELRASAAGRFAIISSTAVARPLAGGANYAAVKAASETWTRAVAHGFAKAARDAGEPLRAAAVVFRVRSLDDVRDAVARAVAGLWDDTAESLNDRVIDVTG
ncbi:NADP-dependent 3-hydroxy acid dehydrogenase YdfG [Microbacterium resistens]|uniref:NADP-dependent 3-hydroxy acid dehydrogenase YdfG n=1 Tax=Microbacterium resistens TaxID=156977 RepID=A0ABU1SAT7_9MICO|nr:SDR family oxidoreductase [Microbacterium resistens]MDR6866674.1 NADP-dependent 3-hydroxy acid dehydrogenase YdfG [Microbacterium resistens]